MAAVGKRKQAAFLNALRCGNTVAAAARAAGVSRGDVYALKASDDAFADAWAAAWTVGADALEDEAMRRAIDGVEKPVFRGGEIVGHVRDYSDSMLMFLLKNRKPDIFRDSGSKTAEMVGDFAGEIEDAKASLRRKLSKVTQPAKKK